MTSPSVKAKRYVIWAQPLTRSHGTRVLYMLYERLRAKGCRAVLFCPTEHRDEYEYIDILDEKTLAEDIVVYPEIVSGNPLRFQNVVRFVLYFPGVLAGETSYHPGELVFTWSTDYYNAPCLFWPTIDKTLFYDAGLPKTQDCYFINKRGIWKKIPEIHGAVEINMDFPKTREELARLLQTTRVLYSFEDYSIIHDEASLCGAQVEIVSENGLIDYVPYFKDGIMDDALVENMLDNFIRLTQKMSYTGALQEEEPFFHHYTGIFYHAAGRCAALGAWSDALDFCRKAYLGKPLRRPKLELPQSPGRRGVAKGRASAPKDEEGFLNLFLHLAVIGRYAEAERLLAIRLVQRVREGNAPVVSAYCVLLALCCACRGNEGEAAEAESLALTADPLNAQAAHLGVLRSLEQGKFNHAVFLAGRLLHARLRPLDITGALPGLALLGLIVAGNREKLADVAEKMSAGQFSADAKPGDCAGKAGAGRRLREMLRSGPLGRRLAALAGGIS
jgi:hypothetical protein